VTSTSENDEALLAELLDGKPVESFDARALGAKGAWRAERDQHLAAALLFEAAAQRAAAAGDRTGWIEWLARAGLRLYDAGRVTSAIPILRRTIEAHLEQPGNRDAFMVEWCYARLLRLAASEHDAPAFRATFEEAVASCRAVGRAFPSIHPHQEELLEAAHGLDCADERRALADAIYRRRPISRALRARLKELALSPR